MTGRGIANATLLVLALVAGLWFYMQISDAVKTMKPLNSIDRYNAIAATIK